MSSHNHHKKETLSVKGVVMGICAGAAVGVVLALVWYSSINFFRAPQPTLSIAPASAKILQGEPVEFILSGTTTPASLRSAILWRAGTATALHFAPYGNSLVAFYGVPLTQKAGTSSVTVTLRAGGTLEAEFQVATRTQPQEYLAVPAKLGGNSVANQEHLVSVLDEENAELKAVTSTSTALWSGAFRFPVAKPAVTDGFGITRESGAVSIVHEGTDFAAPPGTPVYAINRGIVKIAAPFTAYGNTVVLDHGLGVQSLYMHLSSIGVKAGQIVERGQLLGYSGETGYSEGPHLHLSIKINGISIDPMKFLALF